MVTGLFDFSCFLFRERWHLWKPDSAVIEIFMDTLVPASLVGLFSTLAGLVFSGWIGDLVDRTARLRFVKQVVAVEKAGAMYRASSDNHRRCTPVSLSSSFVRRNVTPELTSCSLVRIFEGDGFFRVPWPSWMGPNLGRLDGACSDHLCDQLPGGRKDWPQCCIREGLVSPRRGHVDDRVSTISQGDPKHLTLLNAWMRRIDLCSKLGAPVSPV